MALSLVGNTGRGQIWVGLSSVMSKEAPIPPAPSCEAAQPNHGHPSVEVACHYTSQVNRYFRKQCTFAPCYSLFREQRRLAWALYFLALMFTHSANTENTRHANKLIEVQCIFLKLVKSSLVTYHNVPDALETSFLFCL